ncbi:nucleolar complex protein 4 homolog B [Ischnura elegans]|uniref:nucleolar complex protein 4 homolog B n=1 Tax=Ischnura elegans TaxID=197161 RepID=UPI001ED86B01|nr:nucleolar complex protein 4 homolog B [Ischnura elegans]
MPKKEKPQSKSFRKKLKLLTRGFLESRKNANNLIDVLGCIKEESAEFQPWALAVESIFSDVLQKREMMYTLEKRKDSSSDKDYPSWLRECYEDAIKILTSALETGEFLDQAQALTSLMKFVTLEGKLPLKQDVKETYFPAKRLKGIILKMLSSDLDMKPLILRLSEWSMCPDVRYHVWMILVPFVKQLKEPSDILQCNIFSLMDVILPAKMVNERKKESDVPLPLCHVEGRAQFEFDEKLEGRWLDGIWKAVGKWKRNELTTHHQMLMLLLTKVLHKLSNPLPLTDLLFDSFEQGGSTSLLALQGIFILIQKHNLEYPNIYAKLYSLFEPQIFSTKYKQRLFYLADIFLSSSHLPESMVASFVKRLSRLALVAPPHDISLILAFMGNLILRHPGLKKMVDNPGGGTVDSDPFLPEENDPMNTKALESSLWEVKSLQRHILPSVATAARFIDNNLPSVEWDLEPLLEGSLEKLFEAECKKKYKEVALTFERPRLPCQPHRKDDVLSKFWRLT